MGRGKKRRRGRIDGDLIVLKNNFIVEIEEEKAGGGGGEGESAIRSEG